MGIDSHCPINGTGCRIVSAVCFHQRGRAGSSAAVPAADILFDFGCRIILAAILECKPCNIAAQACAAVVHILWRMALIGDGNGLAIRCSCNWENGKIAICPVCRCCVCSVHLYRAGHQRTAAGELIVKCQIIFWRKVKTIRLECNRPIGGGAGAVCMAGRVSLLCQPCRLGYWYGVAAADDQSVEHAIFTGKQFSCIAYLLAACAVRFRQKKIIVDGGLIGYCQRFCRISLCSLTCVEFCTAKGQGRAAAVRWRFYDHIRSLATLNFITGSIGCNRLTVYHHAAIDIAVQRGINGVPQLKGGVKCYRVIWSGVLPGSIVDRPGDRFVCQAAVLINLRFCRYRLVFCIAKRELSYVFKLHRVEVAVALYGGFTCWYIVCPVAVQIEIGVLDTIRTQQERTIHIGKKLDPGVVAVSIDDTKLFFFFCPVIFFYSHRQR